MTPIEVFKNATTALDSDVVYELKYDRYMVSAPIKTILIKH